jgi:hypothetical protein
MTVKGEISEPVPAVVGTQTSRAFPPVFGKG